VTLARHLRDLRVAQRQGGCSPRLPGVNCLGPGLLSRWTLPRHLGKRVHALSTEPGQRRGLLSVADGRQRRAGPRDLPVASHSPTSRCHSVTHRFTALARRLEVDCRLHDLRHFLPDPHGLVVTGAGQEPSVGAERYPVDRLGPKDPPLRGMLECPDLGGGPPEGWVASHWRERLGTRRRHRRWCDRFGSGRAVVLLVQVAPGREGGGGDWGSGDRGRASGEIEQASVRGA
jgi:hypothetical protein